MNLDKSQEVYTSKSNAELQCKKWSLICSVARTTISNVCPFLPHE